MTTRSTWLLGALALVALAAACGDDGGNNPSNTCGDGALGGSEQCDDGNTAGGDGCSATCQTETTGGVCGDMTVDPGETCDDGGTVDGDGCSATCQTESDPDDCGNGVLDAGEECDDNNTTPDDGCTTCTVDDGFVCTGEPSVCAVPDGTCAAPFPIALTDNAGVLEGTGSGDTTGGTSQVGEASCDDGLAGSGNDHIYQLTLPDTRDVDIEIDGTSAFDAVLRVLSAPCDVGTEVSEFGTADGCADATIANEFLAYVALPAGTYYIVIDGYDAAALGAYSFTVTARPTECGDGMLDLNGYEFCDDNNLTPGDGCDARCEVEPGYACDDAEPSVCTLACGNGILDLGEECDDGANVDGDRCSATCTLEYDVLEVEPNDATPQALTAGSHIIKGELTAGDVDLYTFTLTGEATVELETYNRINNVADYEGVGTLVNVDCYNGLDTVVGVSDATTTLFGDDEDGDLSCSYVGPNDSDGDTTQGVLQAGTYTIDVSLFSATATAPLYILDLKITPTSAAPVAGDLVINEIMAADNMSDTNCDGSTTDTVDEFVELVNVSNRTLDLTGVTISESNGVRFTFEPAATGSMMLEPGKAVVVWGGGAPACPGVTNWFVAPSGLALNDNGDTVSIATGDTVPVPLASVVFSDAQAVVNISLNLSPDVTGTAYALHNAVTGAVGDWTPGLRADGTAF